MLARQIKANQEAHCRRGKSSRHHHRGHRCRNYDQKDLIFQGEKNELLTIESEKNKRKSSLDRSKAIDLEIDAKTNAVFNRKNYKVIERINQGAFSQVYRGEYLVDHRSIAIKVMDLNKLSQMFRVKYIPRELKALIECRHKNVVQIYDIIRSNNRLFIFMEFCSNGDLASYIKRNGPCNDQLARFWFQQLIDALMHIHFELRMAHRDIKLDNVLLDNKFNAKLTDFGFAKDSWNESKNQVELSGTICGTEPYMCPQLMQRTQYDSYSADIWAMGVVLYCFLNAKFPFTWTNSATALNEMQNYPKYISSVFDEKVNEEAIDLVVKMLNPDEKSRITLESINEHPWLCKESSTN
ncbi:testis-specific serine/threonine-protein kinase 1-like protein 2 [Sarcoptes scabiei]|nr:testis-specific serine/threonine-protein kinase 1-like protein 2 [Sarcoptes scabiei]